MTPQYSVPSSAKELFRNGILNNPFIAKNLPFGIAESAQKITFTGSDEPSIPINWRFAESISALKAYEAAVLNVLLEKKYGIGPVDIEINTDHAQLFIMSLLLWVLDPDGAKLSASPLDPAETRRALFKYFPEWDPNNCTDVYRLATSNIYKTKDGKFYHLHGSMNPDVTLGYMGLPLAHPCATLDEAIPFFETAVGNKTTQELEELANQYRQAGTTCWTTEEYKSSEHGRANADVGLFELHAFPNPIQGPSWWPSTVNTSPTRPLAGLKVVDLTRVIAGPTITRGLAELGASVMRVVGPHLPDTAMNHADLNHGKWNTLLDLRIEADRRRLRELVLEADVFVSGYRQGALDKFGFGEQDVIALCRERERGIIYCAENCYGWNGPWAPKSGWQQISDANTGVSYEFGRAMGVDEPVTPVFPNSDYCTGVVGLISTLTALCRRGEEGGSYSVKTALNYYSQWLVDSCGVYPDEVWGQLWKRHGSFVYRHSDGMQRSLPAIFQSIKKTSGDKLFKPEFFTQYHVKNLGLDMRIVAPVLKFPNGEVKPRFDVGVRTNGIDQPRWPVDLATEVVA